MNRRAWNKHVQINQMYLGISLLVIALSGCSTGKESFSSEPGKGFGWRSMSENHQRIADMYAPVSLDVKPPVIADSSGTSAPGTDESGAPYRVAASPWIDTDVARTPEQYLRIWIPPFQDEQGNLHEEQAVHTIIQQGQWLIPNYRGIA